MQHDKGKNRLDYHCLIAKYGSPLMILDCNIIAYQYQKLRNALPNVNFYYALKASSHTAVIKTLHRLGCYFDAASQGEIQCLGDHLIHPAHSIYTHPIKSDNDIRTALRYGCTTFIIDNIDELKKFSRFRHRVRLLLRLCFKSQTAVVDLSNKFGCAPSEALLLMRSAQQLNITINGFSFNVGSQSLDSNAYVTAINACTDLRKKAADSLGTMIRLLDIGGGFPVRYQSPVLSIEEFCAPIRKALKSLPDSISVIAEPGRFIAAPAMKNLCRVIGKAYRNGCPWYYLDDGLYGAFSGQLYDRARYPITVLTNNQDTKKRSVLAGPTCDGIDVIAEDILLPTLKIGDVVIGHQMGAYTLVSASNFNALPPPKVAVIPLNICEENSTTAVFD